MVGLGFEKYKKPFDNTTHYISSVIFSKSVAKITK